MTRRLFWWERAAILAAVLLVVLPLALLVGCSDGNKLTQGEVIEKGYDDPDTWTESTSYCMARNYRTGMCMAYGYSSYERHDGPHWSLRVVGVDDEGKERREWHEVTQTLYELAEVGVTVDFPGDRVVPR